MKEIKDLIYTLQINYKNKLSVEISISNKIFDSGLEIKSIKIGDICITEETINGRVLSGRYDNLDEYCGYRYDYQNGETLLNINPNVSLDSAISLINKTKMGSEFIAAKMVFSSISRNDFRVVTLNDGRLNITKTISAENEKSENCSFQEIIELLKLDGEESFVPQYNKRIYKIGNECEVEENQTLVDSDVMLQINELIHILNQHPLNHKELIELKEQIQKRTIINYIDEEKCYE